MTATHEVLFLHYNPNREKQQHSVSRGRFLRGGGVGVF